jgi:hypothetical protein
MTQCPAVGRNGLRQLAFGPAATAHPFERRAEAEDIARWLRRRVSTADYDFVVEEASAITAALSAALGPANSCCGSAGSSAMPDSL